MPWQHWRKPPPDLCPPEMCGKLATMKKWFLYLIECLDGSIYTGIAVDVAARYAAHAAGKGARYTRAHPPARLLAVVEFANRSEALKAEYAVKQWTPAQKRAWIDQVNNEIPH